MNQRPWGRVTMFVALLAGVLASGVTPAAATDADGRRTFTGTIDGADFRVEVPARWNRTLVLYSHPYYSPDAPPGVKLSNRPETEGWLLDHGFALAGSDFVGRFGFTVEPALHDQIALLDWFDANVGRPRRTVAFGASMGGGISVLLSERNPQRFAGVASLCGPIDLNASWNLALDVNFAVKTLLAPGQPIELVHPTDPAASIAALQRAVAEALTTPRGRARLALVNALANVVGWNSVSQPRPTDPVERIRQQAAVDSGFYIAGFGPSGRVDLERRAGGNPSFNTGIDYTRQLARSDQRAFVEQAYRIAELDPRADLDRLAAAPRIAADPAALAYMYRFAVPLGSTPAPVFTVHTTGDGGAVPDHEQWYAEQVRRSGNPDLLRQVFVDRGTHCAFSAAEEIVTLRVLIERLDSGRWPDIDPQRLSAAAARFDRQFQLVFDGDLGRDVVTRPSFIAFTPPRLLRPSR